MQHRKYALELASQMGLGATKQDDTPIDTNINFNTKEYDDHDYKNTEGTNDPLENVHD